MRKLLLTTLITSCAIAQCFAQKKEPVDYVNTMIGTHDSRPMQFPGAAMPFGMVKLSPNNQESGWKAAHEYNIKNIAGFNFIHDYQMTGFYVMPTCGDIQTQPGPIDNPDKGYRSRISNETEVATPGYYSVILEDYNIKAEVSATTRTGIQRYTFPKSDKSTIMFDLQIPYEDPGNVVDVKVTKVSDTEIEGYIKFEGGQIMGNTIFLVNDYTLNFVSRFSKPFESLGGWQDNNIKEDVSVVTGANDVGCFVKYKTDENEQITVLTAISTVSIDQARLNLETETKEFGFNFDKYRESAREVWNDLLGRIEVSGGSELNKVKFYTNLYRTYCTRTIWSDVNGKWMDMNENVAQSPDGSPIYGCDAFWGMKWNLNGLWSLVNPSLMNSWVKSLLEFHKIGGWLPKGPTSGEYTAIMTSSPAVSLIVAAYQQGIRDYDIELAYESIKHIMMEQGRVHKSGSYVGNRWLKEYKEYGYVPQEVGPASATFELSFQDWCVAQMAKDLGKMEDYEYFMNRSMSYKNHFDPQKDYARPKSSSGSWIEPFSAFSSNGFIEGNGWQYTFHVPHDIQGVINFMGKEEYLKRLNWGFEESKKSKFNATGDQYARFPINHGNQPNMQAAYLFNYGGAPWMTQRWSREILDIYYGATPTHGWPGDEDEGQMGAWYVMSAMGLFQMQGGCSVDPIYDLGSPQFEKITINLENGKKIKISAKNNSETNYYVQSVKLNGKPINKAWIYVSDIQNGGKLEFVMGPEPNKQWGIGTPPPSISKEASWQNNSPELVISSNNSDKYGMNKFLEPIEISIKSNLNSGIIRYTTDGSTPNSNSPIYTKPFTITTTQTISAMLYNKEGKEVTSIRRAKFNKMDYEKNITTNQKVTASSFSAGNTKPENAVDGFVDLSKFWDASPWAQWWQVELENVTEIKETHLFTYWDGGRAYKYNIEISLDGKNWTKVVDASNNKKVATSRGYRDTFTPQKAKFIRVNMLENNSNRGVHIVEFRAY